MKLAKLTYLSTYSSNAIIISCVAFALVALLVLILFVDFKK